MDQLTYIRKPIEEELGTFCSMFDNTMSKANGMLLKICEGVSKRKGKLMRPILLLLVAKEWGRVSDPAYYSALTLELLHNASLIHDDIVDESNERRGQPSVRAIYGNKVGVLAGDYLLSSSLESASLTGNIRIVNAIARLGKQLSHGEIIQLSNTRHNDFSEQTYFEVIRLKTASLFSAASKLGAVAAGADEKDVEDMYRLGDIIGLCFQIRDDIFDYYNNDVGKPTSNDMQEGKLTLPVLYALNNSKDADMHSMAIKVKEGKASMEDIATLVSFTKQQGGIEYARQRMEDFSQEAKMLIANFKHTEIKDALNAYIDFVCQRSL